MQLEFVLHTAPAVHFFSIAKHCPLPCTADRRDVHALQRSALSEAELSEIRAIERVGHRRRKQWLNDKLLRDLAGPMSTQDMGRQRAAQGGVLVPIHSVAACSGQCRQVEAES